ncbi:DNA-binding anti-repressor SinI [Evansella tamaricis]|uniref:Anti-repressor SinI family protein n=1 Tax=Evansella tamaricis TaxID=2069301 RepID=A0ABS6JJS7_9BACI|nr:DNA-binding anti-repressor SinI [Evansella tamaricis]MBU9712568.1 anti-repressor SinI family protein [Evansella tamaricis]
MEKLKTKKITEEMVDKEWAELLKEAKELGLSPTVIRYYLQTQKKN